EGAVGVAVEPAGEEVVEVARTQVDRQGLAAVQREGEVADGAEVPADGAAEADDALDERLALAEGPVLGACGADGLVADAAPGAAGRLAAAAGGHGRLARGGHQAEPFHVRLSPSATDDGCHPPFFGSRPRRP